MVWYLFALLAAVTDASYYASLKRHLERIDKCVLATGVFLLSALFLFVVSGLKGIPLINPQLFVVVGITGVLNVIAFLLYFEALRLTDISLSMPMLSLTPLFLLVTSFVLLGEFPSLMGVAGIFLIIVGSYLLHRMPKEQGILAPFRSIYKNKGVLFMVLVAFLFSISANFDKLVVLYSDVVFGSALKFLFMGLCFLFVSLAGKREGLQISWKQGAGFLVPGLFLTISIIAMNFALTLSIVPYVVSLKRTSALFSVLYGGLLFKEKQVLQRGIGALVMVMGVVLILLG